MTGCSRSAFSLRLCGCIRREAQEILQNCGGMIVEEHM